LQQPHAPQHAITLQAPEQYDNVKAAATNNTWRSKVKFDLRAVRLQASKDTICVAGWPKYPQPDQDQFEPRRCCCTA